MVKKILWPVFWLIVLALVAEVFASVFNFHTWSAVLAGALALCIVIVLVLSVWTAIVERRDKGKDP